MQSQAFWNDSVRRRRNWYGLRQVFGQIVDVFASIGGGYRMSRRFDELTSQGMPARDAVRKVFEEADAPVKRR